MWKTNKLQSNCRYLPIHLHLLPSLAIFALRHTSSASHATVVSTFTYRLYSCTVPLPPDITFAGQNAGDEQIYIYKMDCFCFCSFGFISSLIPRCLPVPPITKFLPLCPRTISPQGWHWCPWELSNLPLLLLADL